jgi:hypothetical protein
MSAGWPDSGTMSHMHRAISALLVTVGLFVLAGPAFGLAGALTGAEVTVTGGPTRVVFDLTMGTALLVAGTRHVRAAPQLAR